jgi:alpha-tubulin suppressor-like RCC1 family protein
MVSGGRTFARISAGHDYTCGITTSGEANCWGASENGQLGTGVPGRPAVHVPTAVATSLRFTDIVASGFHTCAIATTGQAYCWGSGAAGRLGTGSTAIQLVPAPVLGGLTFTQITAGYLHTCGLTTTGQAYCWGYGGSGQLGTGSTIDQPTPATVAGGLTFASISAGYVHTCGVSAMTEQPYCWGAGAGGRLGIGTTANQLSPVPVAPLP